MNKRQLVFSVAVVVCMIGAWAGLTLLSVHRHEVRVQREITFLQIGKKVAAAIQGQHEVPQSTEGLRTSGWLGISEWSFFEQNRISYVPPRTNAPPESIILRMPYEGNVYLVVELSGLMKKDYAARSGPHDNGN